MITRDIIASWTIAALTRELARIGAELSHCGQNRNTDHLGRHPPGWWGVVLMLPRVPGHNEHYRMVTAFAPSLPIALAKAIRDWEAWTPPTYGKRDEVASLDGDSLLQTLGLL